MNILLCNISDLKSVTFDGSGDQSRGSESRIPAPAVSVARMSPAKTALQCFIDDKETLFRAFKRCDSPAFTNFAKCWKDMKFSLVLYGRRMREFKEWLPLCYTAVLPDLRQFHLIDRRVFALFLLYGIYFKQPLKELIPVRVSLTVMQDMDELKHYAIREQLLDVLFVWHKLLSSGGIQIVHSATFYGPLFAKSAKGIVHSRRQADGRAPIRFGLADGRIDRPAVTVRQHEKEFGSNHSLDPGSGP